MTPGCMVAGENQPGGDKPGLLEGERVRERERERERGQLIQSGHVNLF